MNIKIGALTEALVAKETLQGPLLEVDSLAMDFEGPFAAEGLGTEVTFVGLSLEMDGTHVYLHVVLATEALPAVVACVRALLEMDGGGMSVKTALLSELEAALWTGEGACLVVCTRDVAIVGRDAREGFSAETALDAMGWAEMVGGLEMGGREGGMGKGWRHEGWVSVGGG